jgi:hypothetical protein
MPFLFDIIDVGASSYPSRAIEANPAVSLEMRYLRRA